MGSDVGMSSNFALSIRNVNGFIRPKLQEFIKYINYIIKQLLTYVLVDMECY